METFSALLAICAGNSPVTSEFPAQRPVTRSFDVFFYLRLLLLSKQSWGWWLRRHCAHYDVTVMCRLSLRYQEHLLHASILVSAYRIPAVCLIITHAGILTKDEGPLWQAVLSVKDIMVYHTAHANTNLTIVPITGELDFLPIVLEFCFWSTNHLALYHHTCNNYYIWL